jgi:hypothetical protein
MIGSDDERKKEERKRRRGFFLSSSSWRINTKIVYFFCSLPTAISSYAWAVWAAGNPLRCRRPVNLLSVFTFHKNKCNQTDLSYGHFHRRVHHHEIIKKSIISLTSIYREPWN